MNAGLKNGSKESLYKTFNYGCFQDKNLSWRARGVLAYLLSKPDNWNGQLYDLLESSKEGRKTVQKILKELVSVGYAKLKRYPKINGKFTGSYYEFYDSKQNNENEK